MLLRVLVVDDDPQYLSLARGVLAGGGYEAEGATTAEEALDAVRKSPPDLLVLDWQLPDRSGIDVCSILRNDPKTAPIPILMLSVKGKIKERVEGLDVGADDYLTKPFEPSELLARARAVLRRKTPWLLQTQPLEFKGLKLDPTSYKALVRGKDAGLSKSEFEILYILAANAGHIVLRKYLEDRVLEIDHPTDARELDVYMSNLRKKLGPKAGGRIETARGLGYLFASD